MKFIPFIITNCLIVTVTNADRRLPSRIKKGGSSADSPDPKSDIPQILPLSDQDIPDHFRGGDENNNNNKNGSGYVVRHDFIDLSQILSSRQNGMHLNALEVRVFHDVDSVVFTKVLDSDYDNDSRYYWYGENGQNYFNIQIHDERCAGTLMMGDKYYDFMTLIDGRVMVQQIYGAYMPSETDQDEGRRGKLRLRQRHGRDRNLERSNNQEETFVKNITTTETLSSFARKEESLPNKTEIDILCLYTRFALVELCIELKGKKCDSDYEDYIRAMDDKCEHSVSLTNTAFELSGVNAFFTLLHTQLVDHASFTEETSLCAMKSKMVSPQPDDNQVYWEIRNLRDHYGADLVGLITGSNEKYCGCGSQNHQKALEDFSDEMAYFVATNECAVRDYTFSHEIGHAFGCYHNYRGQYSTSQHANGWRDPDSKFRTIMSYACEDKWCDRILRFSTSEPSLTYNGLPFGDENHNNAKEINYTKSTIASYRSKLSTGAVVPIPTPAPSPNEPQHSLIPKCTWDKSLLEVSIRTDHKPGELSWALMRDGVKETDGYLNHNEKNKVIKYYECVPAGYCYKFVIKDTGGDGIQNGGWFTVKDGDDMIINEQSLTSSSKEMSVAMEGRLKHPIGWEIVNEYNIRTKSSKSCKWLAEQDKWKRDEECLRSSWIREKCGHACQTCTTQLEPTLYCEWDKSLLEILVKTDNKPQEISWELNNSQGIVVASSSNYAQSNTLVRQQKCVLAGECYKLKLRDVGGDGIQNGYIKIVESGQVIVQYSTFTSSGAEYHVPVEGNRKYDIGVDGQLQKCNWLDTQTQGKRDRECDRYFIKKQCVRVCNTC